MKAIKVLMQLELVLEENNTEVQSILLRKNSELSNSIVLDGSVSMWFNENNDYIVRYKGDYVLTTRSLTSALDTVVELYKRYKVLTYISGQ
ncbi:hypothetical protein [Mammaliicoccus virus vB_MscM-PMS2]|nr:hypothetical protein [Mammaliicoccus virus vB_MscM-PMS2]